MLLKKTQNVVIIVLFLLSLPGIIAAQTGNHCTEAGVCYYHMTGSWNTFCGNYAGRNNTTGSANSIFGFHAGSLNTTGSYNTFLGFNAGYTNTTGRSNTFAGFKAGRSNTIGDYNTFLGVCAGYSNTTGAYNTFLGRNAGYSNTTGVSNIFIGHEAGKSNTTAVANTFVGVQAGKLNSTGEQNTYLGLNAGFSNTEGNRNTFLGTYAGNFNETGNENTFLGYSSGSSNVTGSGNVFIGYQAGFYETGSDKLYIANGPNNSNTLIYGDFLNDKVGINTTTPGYELEVNGTICGTFCSGSDIRLKKDVKPIEKALDQIARLRGVTFHWKDKKNDNGQQVGVIAQEVEKVFPQVVSTGSSGYKSVAYSNLVAPLIEAVKELKTHNEKAFKAIKILKAENEALKEMIIAIEKKMKD